MKDVSSYAKCDPAFAMDGLFVPYVKKGQALYDVGREWDKGMVSFKGVQLGVSHQSVLLAVCARTGRDGLKVKGTAKDPRGKQLSLLLEADGDAEGQELAQVEVTAYALLADAGMGDGARDYKRLAELLHDLSTVSVYRRIGSKGGSMKLLSYRHDSDHFTVHLNWRLASAIFGGQNFQVSLYEREQLSGGVAKILHTWLSAHIRRGGSLMAGRGASVDALIPHVWGTRPVSASAKNNRRSQVRSALQELAKLDGWAVVEDRRKVFVSRPQALPEDGWAGLLPGDVGELLADLEDDE